MEFASAPRTVEEVSAIVRAAVADGQPIEPVGGGTQVHVGYDPERPPSRVSLCGLNGIVDYAPEDLVVVAGAGMTVSSLQSVLAEQGQRLPLDVGLPERQTLGGIVAARANSLIRAANGSVRDWLIGCKVVGGEGQAIVAGGKVVKNVAGYDLPKLYCGSWGTLGIITETAFKVAPLCEHSRTILVTLNAERNSEEVLDSLSRSVRPAFTYLLNPDAAHGLLGENAPDAQFLVLGFEGGVSEVDAMERRANVALAQDAFQVLALPDDVGRRVRALLRDLPMQPSPLTVRCSILPSRVGAFARMLEWTSRRAGFAARVVADATCGIVWALVRPRDAEDGDIATDGPDHGRWMRLYPDLRDKIDRVGGACVFERMPQPWRDAGTPVWSPVLGDVQWMHALKAEIDPHGIFRPGRFVDRL